VVAPPRLELGAPPAPGRGKRAGGAGRVIVASVGTGSRPTGVSSSPRPVRRVPHGGLRRDLARVAA
jgi:hypothetical protein